MGWQYPVALISALVAVLMFLLYLIQYRKGKTGQQGDKGDKPDKWVEIAVRSCISILAVAILAILIFHKKVTALMEVEQRPTYVVPQFTLPTVVVTHDTTWYGKNEAGDGTIQLTSTPPPNPLSIPIPATKAWTPTGIMVGKGQIVDIKAKGEIIVSPHSPRMSPDGTRKPCYPNPEIHNWNFPAADLACGSLIGRIGGQAPFAVGSSMNFRAPASGLLWLGVNDNWFDDNHGEWDVTIFVKDEKSK